MKDNKPVHQVVKPKLLNNSGDFARYKKSLPATIIHAWGWQFVLLGEKKIPINKGYFKRWPSEVEVWRHVEAGGDIGIIPASNRNLPLSIIDIDNGNYKNITKVAKPLFKYQTKRGWHLAYFAKNWWEKKKLRRVAYDCKFDLITKTGYVKLHDLGKAMAIFLCQVQTRKIEWADIENKVLPESILNAGTESQILNAKEKADKLLEKKAHKAEVIGNVNIRTDIEEMGEGDGRYNSLFKATGDYAKALYRRGEIKTLSGASYGRTWRYLMQDSECLCQQMKLRRF